MDYATFAKTTLPYCQLYDNSLSPPDSNHSIGDLLYTMSYYTDMSDLIVSYGEKNERFYDYIVQAPLKLVLPNILSF